MYYLTNLKDLQYYKKQLLHQQELLFISPVFTDTDKELVNECYEDLLQITDHRIALYTEVEDAQKL